MYRDVTHSYREIHLHRMEEMAHLHRIGDGSFRLRISLGTWLIALGQRLVAGPAVRSAAIGSGV
ncbi:MAG: hypothetical protein PVJ28_08470 [Acidimicrobiia bacterium]|jgi:hypothetical protein